MSTIRLKKEFRDLLSKPIPNITANPIGQDFFNWSATILDPEGTPYADGIFFLSIHIPEAYPFNPPEVKFLTRVFHPNVGEDGMISLNILHREWTPSLTIGKVLLSISAFLADPDPNPPKSDAPLMPEIAELYNTHRGQFIKKAKEWTKEHAN